jgi:hypothetical protein
VLSISDVQRHLADRGRSTAPWGSSTGCTLSRSHARHPEPKRTFRKIRVTLTPERLPLRLRGRDRRLELHLGVGGTGTHELFRRNATTLQNQLYCFASFSDKLCEEDAAARLRS